MTKMVFRSFFFLLVGRQNHYLLLCSGWLAVTAMDFWDSPDGTIDWMRRRGLLMDEPPPCDVPECKRKMVLIRDNYSMNRYRWRCQRHKKRKVSVRAGSVWSESRLLLQDLMLLLFLFCSGREVFSAAAISEVDWKTVDNWYSKFRKYCTKVLGAAATMDDRKDEQKFRQIYGNRDDGGERMFQRIVRAISHFSPIRQAHPWAVTSPITEYIVFILLSTFSITVEILQVWRPLFILLQTLLSAKLSSFPLFGPSEFLQVFFYLSL